MAKKDSEAGRLQAKVWFIVITTLYATFMMTLFQLVFPSVPTKEALPLAILASLVLALFTSWFISRHRRKKNK